MDSAGMSSPCRLPTAAMVSAVQYGCPGGGMASAARCCRVRSATKDGGIAAQAAMKEFEPIHSALARLTT